MIDVSYLSIWNFRWVIYYASKKWTKQFSKLESGMTDDWIQRCIFVNSQRIQLTTTSTAIIACKLVMICVYLFKDSVYISHHMIIYFVVIFMSKYLKSFWARSMYFVLNIELFGHFLYWKSWHVTHDSITIITKTFEEKPHHHPYHSDNICNWCWVAERQGYTECFDTHILYTTAVIETSQRVHKF